MATKKKKTKMTPDAPMYIYATEMVSGYYSKLSLKGEKILTISGSGDQVLNAYFFGAKDVVSFDLNKNSFFITQIKFTAIKILSYTEFLKFFGTKHNNTSLDYKLYKKIRPNLDKKTRNFFDSTYKKNSYSGSKIIKSEKYFRQRGNLLLKPANIVNIYLKNEKNYLKLRNLIKDQKLFFIQSDITNINKNSKEKFDLINISNVINYLSDSVKSDDPEKYIINLLTGLRKNLKKNGRIILYAYSLAIYANRIRKSVPPASRKSFINRIKNETDFTVKEKKMVGINNKTIDKIVVLIKT